MNKSSVNFIQQTERVEECLSLLLSVLGLQIFRKFVEDIRLNSVGASEDDNSDPILEADTRHDTCS